MRATRSPVRSLSQAVAASFTAAAITPNEQKIGIAHPDLAWICPPLLTESHLRKVRLQEYYDFPCHLLAEQVVPFWQDTLLQLASTPSLAVEGVSLLSTRKLMPTERTGVRALRFSIPAGYPAGIDDTTGIVLSMELAQAVYLALPVKKRVVDDSNFYVVMKDGTTVGVVNGRAAIDDPWNFDAAGMVHDFATMPRGQATVGCWFDSLAYARSLLYTYKSRFPEFDAVDSAIQALRYLTMGSVAPDLMVALQVSPHMQLQTAEKVRLLEDSISVVELDVSDRDKLATIKANLVPSVMTVTEFRTKIFASPDVPFMLAPGKMDKIVEYLRSKCEALRATM